MANPNNEAARWNRQFAAGEWAYLRDLSELAHHSIVAGYIAHRGQAVSVLDIACGEGELRALLPHNVCYLGVDWSSVAIENALQHGPLTRFVVADAERYIPTQQFDFVVFNECLYYFRSPVAVLHHYAEHLTEDGCFVVSMYETADTLRLWQILADDFETLDRVQVRHARGTSWHIGLLQPRSARNRKS